MKIEEIIEILKKESGCLHDDGDRCFCADRNCNGCEYKTTIQERVMAIDEAIELIEYYL